MSEKLIKKRSSLKAKVTNFNNYIKILKSSEKLSDLQVLDLENRFKNFETILNDFDNLQTEIELLSDDPEPEDIYAERFKFEELYYPLIATAQSLLGAARQHQQHNSSAGSVSNSEVSGGTKNNFIRLPKIDLPRFDGSYQCWLEYRDTFLSLIHNNHGIDSINKFHYLRASLQGAAAEIIKNIDFKSDNYEMAWDLLCDRFNNSRLLITNHVQALFNAEPIKNECSVLLRQLTDTINKNIRALKALNEPTQHWDTLIIYMMSLKLDSITSRNWEEYRNNLTSSPTLLQFCTFVNNKADLLETLEENKKILSNTNNSNSFVITSNQHSNNYDNNVQNRNIIICPLCTQNHYLYSCDAFRKLTIEDRLQKAKEFNVCMNCLRVGHVEKRCRFSHCKYCKSRHNTLLHLEAENSLVEHNPMPTPSHTNVSLSANIQPTSHKNVLLSTAVVRVVSDKGKRYNARVLLDSGSTAHFITNSLCDKLGLSRVDTSSKVTGINNQTCNSAQSCKLTIESSYNNYTAKLNCLILPEITRKLPASYIDIERIPIPTGLSLADPSFNIPSDIDILLGAEVFWDVIQGNHINLGKNLPRLCESKLGWLISGSVPTKSKLNHSHSHFCNFSRTDSIELKNIDSILPKRCLSLEERACENHLNTTERNADGRFVVSMPPRADPAILSDSYVTAKRRFLSLEKQFERHPKFKRLYMEFMHEYESRAYMELCSNARHSVDLVPEAGRLIKSAISNCGGQAPHFS
ncbi:hypothetical protein ABMA27_013061 [Loxostege sticticalis]|uniref:Peptidase aspartic putative domain-containing protein n=1 Tax=Loxostege sticticalis TaxID=481309 RepID=A0ABR3IDY1_LOXSC